MSYFSPQPSLTYWICCCFPLLTPASIHDSGALTPDISAAPSSQRRPLLRNEGAPLGGDAEARHRCKPHSILTLKPKPEGKMARPSRDQVAEENKEGVTPCVPQTNGTVTMKGTASCNSAYLTSGTPTCKVKETLTFLHP